MDDGQFGENPFRELDLSRFPADKDAQAEADNDRHLFLRAWDRLPAQPDKKRAAGFLLGDLCQMPTPRVNKKPALPTPAPAPQPPEPTDAAIFADAMRNAAPLSGKGRKVPRPKPARPGADAMLTLADYLAKNLQFAVSYSAEYLEGCAAGLDPLIMSRLRQGQFSHEAHLDLHGLNAGQAFEALREFMRQAWLRGLRNVLIVTGRGRNSPAGMAILRQKLPYWLTHEPFKRIVLAFCTAQPHDGGPGSIYVLLRRARKKGPVRWQTLAFDCDSF